MFNTLTPNLMVKNIHTSVAFYTDVLGFKLRMAVPEDKSEFPDSLKEGVSYIYAQLFYNDVEIWLQTKESLSEDLPIFQSMSPGAAISFYGKVEDADIVYKAIKDKVSIIKDIKTSWYGMREFYISDPDGYILGFASQDPDFSMS